MRVALFGSPAFALPVLEALRAHHEVALVVTQPDKGAGRGLKLTAPPVAERARALELRLEQPSKLKKNEGFHALVRELDLDVAITAAYGKILPGSLLDLPKHGFLNVHASLLPKYRGAAPIQWALINGEKGTGVSIMQTDVGLDTGPVRLQKSLVIEPEDNALTLFDKLSALGAEALLEALEALERGTLPCHPQDEGAATHAGLLSKEDGEVRWEDSAEGIRNRFRGVVAWPGTWTTWGGGVLKIHGLEAHQKTGSGEVGRVLDVSNAGVLVAAGTGAVLLKAVQPAGKPRMDARLGQRLRRKGGRFFCLTLAILTQIRLI